MMVTLTTSPAHTHDTASHMKVIYCRHGRSGNIRKVLIFANFARRTNSRIQESRENYYYISATKKK